MQTRHRCCPLGMIAWPPPFLVVVFMVIISCAASSSLTPLRGTPTNTNHLSIYATTTAPLPFTSIGLIETPVFPTSVIKPTIPSYGAIRLIASEETAEIMENDPVALRCSAEGPGSSHWKFEWTYQLVSLSYLCQAEADGRLNVDNSSRLLGNGKRNVTSTLSISKVQRCDAGVYSCCVNEQCLHISLKIKSPPVIVVPKSPNISASAAENTSITLQCAATGQPTPTLHWTRDISVHIATSDRYKVQAGGARLVNGVYSDVSSKLTVSLLQVNDSKDYHCFAQSGASFDVATISLLVQDCPACSAVGTEKKLCNSSLCCNCFCKPGVTGDECDKCAEEFYNLTQLGCQTCKCNVNGSNLRSCSVNGTCSCRPNVIGEKCDSCKAGFYDLSASGCAACLCDGTGSKSPGCDQVTGTCFCETNVIGAKCDSCKAGFYNLSTSGCAACLCHATGSNSSTCDQVTGTCSCGTNVIGSKCDSCKAGFYNLSRSGCRACHCNRLGSNSSVCTTDTGVCSCKSGVTGDKCNVCSDTFHSFSDISECTANNGSNVPFNCLEPPPTWKGTCYHVALPGRDPAILDVQPNIVSGDSLSHDGVKIYWNGWTCLTQCSLTYHWALYLLEPVKGSSVKAVHPAKGRILHHTTHQQPVTTPISFQVHPPFSLLMVELNATALNGTTTVSHSLLLIDDDSSVLVSEKSKIMFESAVDGKWLTNEKQNVLDVKWKGHFYNSFIQANPWLLYKVDVPKTKYDTAKLPLSFSGVVTYKDSGVTSFQSSVALKENGGTWKIVNSRNSTALDQSWTLNQNLQTGETYRVEVIAKDVFGHSAAGNATVYTDFTAPNISSPSVWERSTPPIRDLDVCTNGGGGVGSLSLEVTAIDEESGVKEVSVSVNEQKAGAARSQVLQTCFGDFCICGLDGGCVQKRFTIALNLQSGGLPSPSRLSLNVSATSFSGLKNQWTGDVSVGKEGLVKVPTRLSVSNESHSLNVSWSEVDDRTTQVLVIACRRKLQSSECVVCTETTPTSPSERFAVISRLNPFTEYVVQVEVTTSDGESGLSERVIAKTTEGKPTGPPVGANAHTNYSEETDRASISVQWSPPRLEHRNGPITAYYVRTFLRDTFLPPETKVTGTKLTTVVGNLRSGQEYAVTIAAETKAGRGVPSPELSVKTPDGLPNISPGNVSQGQADKSSLTVRWEAIPEDSRNGDIEYVVFYRAQNSNDPKKNVTVPGSQLSVKLTGLETFTEYLVSIAGRTSKGLGRESQEMSFHTDEDVPGPPRISRVDPIGSTALGVSWFPPDNPKGIILAYRIVAILTTARRRRDANATAPSIVVTAGKDDTFKIVDGLESGESYSVSISANTSKGWGESQQHPTPIETPTPSPTAPQGLGAIIREINSTSVRVYWTAPNSTKANFYIIRWHVDGKLDSAADVKVSGGTTEYVIAGLTSYTYYRIDVATDGKNASTVYAWTPEGTPGEVQMFEIPSVDDASALLQWQPPLTPNGKISYGFRYWSLTTGEAAAINRTIQPHELRLVFENRYRWRVSDLNGLTDYRFVMWAYNLKSGQRGKETNPVAVRTEQGRPGPLSDVSVDSENDGSLVVLWKPPRRPNGVILGYEVSAEWSNQTGTPKSFLTIHHALSSTKALTLFGLEVPAQYKVVVLAYNVLGNGIPTEVRATTRRRDVGETAPRNVTVGNITHSTVVVTWETPRETALLKTYNVTVRQQGRDFSRNTIVRETTAVIRDLPSFSLFFVTVVAFYSDGTEGPSNRRFFQTNSSAPSSSPRNLHAEQTENSTSLRVEWVSPPPEDLNGVSCGYILKIFKAIGTHLLQKLSARAKVHQAIVLNLDPYTNYSISASAVTCHYDGEGPSVTVTARTAEGAPRVKTLFLKPTANSVNVSWTVQPNGILQWMRIRLEGREEERMTIEGSVEFFNLTAFTTYLVTAQASSGGGIGENMTETVTTKEAVPVSAPVIQECISLFSTAQGAFNNIDLNFTEIPIDQWRGVPGRYRAFVNNVHAKDFRVIDGPSGLRKEIVTAKDDLKEGQSYKVTLAAYTDAGNGPMSKPCDLSVPKPDSGSSSAIAIALGIVIPIFVIVLVILALFFYWKHDRTGKMDFSGMELEEHSRNRYTDSGNWLDEWPPYEEYQIDRKQLTIGKELGEGQFGKVYLAVARGLKKDEKETKVAVKTVKGGASHETAEDFRKELEIMMDFDHSNVIALLGVCTREEPLYLITELMRHGDLKEFVRNARPSEERVRALLSLFQLLDMASQAVAGVAYLASRKFVHRDIAARNCLVGSGDGDEGKESYVVKIADFGMAKDVYQSDYYRKKGGALPIRWMAPEAITDGKYSIESDAWSMGILLWEIFSFGYQPYFGQDNEKVLGGIISGSIVLPQPPTCPDVIYNLMLRCWQRRPDDRMTAGMADEELKKMVLMCKEKGVGAVYTYSLPERYQATAGLPSASQKISEYVDMTDTMKKAKAGNAYTESTGDGQRKRVTSYVDMAGATTTEPTPASLPSVSEIVAKPDVGAVPNPYAVEKKGFSGMQKVDSYVDMTESASAAAATCVPSLASVPEFIQPMAVPNVYESGPLRSSDQPKDRDPAYVDMEESNPRNSVSFQFSSAAHVDSSGGGQALVNPLYDQILESSVPETAL